ncbi:MAG: hypothetical protein OJJ54_06815 [Pseudonocardia sp.]|nr:hypothetical protein [Pseudonocardia sp.]
MSGFRIPVVAGVSGGVGTTTVALALHGRDGGTEVGAADVVVCRCTAESLSRAGRLSATLGGGPPPVLAVTGGPARRGRVADLLGDALPGWSAVIELPTVTRCFALDDPYAEVRGLLGTQRETLPRPVRAYAAALGRLARAVAESGRLAGPAPRRPASGPLPVRQARSAIEQPMAALPSGLPDARPVIRHPVTRHPDARHPDARPVDEPEIEVPGLRPVRGIRILATPATGSRPGTAPVVNGARR